MLRLSDLLERIRPAGAPGASAEGLSRRARAELDELDELTAALRRIQDEADERIARHRRLADRVRADGEERARALRADLPGRVSAAEIPAADDIGGEPDHIAAIGDREIASRRAAALAETDRLVDRAIAVVWDLLPNEQVTG